MKNHGYLKNKTLESKKITKSPTRFSHMLNRIKTLQKNRLNKKFSANSSTMTYTGMDPLTITLLVVAAVTVALGIYADQLADVLNDMKNS